MGKKQDVDDLLDDTPSKGKTKGKTPPPAAKGAAAKKAALTPVKKGKKAAVEEEEEEEEEEAAPKRVREPVVFDDGEREELEKRIKKLVKKPINSKDLAEKLGIATRKLRRVVYSMAKREEITLEPGESRVTGMTVSPA